MKHFGFRLLAIAVFILVNFPVFAVTPADVLDAIKQVESGGNPYAIRDNTGNRSYAPKSLADAVTQAKALLALSHNIDMGMYQINSIHLKGPGVTVDNIFDATVQTSTAAKIFNDFHTQAKALYGDTDLALWRATGAYNAGNLALYKDNIPYVSRVLAVLGIAPDAGAKSAWAQPTGRSSMQTLFRNVTSGIAIPGEWKIGESLNPMDTDAAKSDNASSDAGFGQQAAGVVAMVLILIIAIVLAKIGLLWWTIKWIVKKAASTAFRQMTKSHPQHS